MAKRKDKNYYKDLASRHSRTARTSQMKLKSFKEGLKEGIQIAKEAQR